MSQAYPIKSSSVPVFHQGNSARSLTAMLHAPKDGKPVAICALTDQHLRNIVAFICRKMASLRQTTNREVTFDSLVMGKRTVSLEESVVEFVGCEATLVPYLLEATIRGLDVAALLKAAYGRDAAAEEPKDELALTSDEEMDFSF